MVSGKEESAQNSALPKKVLILLLMEYGLGAAAAWDAKNDDLPVLILLLMEYGLGGQK